MFIMLTYILSTQQTYELNYIIVPLNQPEKFSKHFFKHSCEVVNFLIRFSQKREQMSVHFFWMLLEPTINANLALS